MPTPKLQDKSRLLLSAALYQQTGEKGSEMENTIYARRKADDLQQRLDAARSKVHHHELVPFSLPTTSYHR